MTRLRSLGAMALYVVDWGAMILIIPFFAVCAAGLLLMTAHPLANREPIRTGYLLSSAVLLLWIAPGYSFWPTRPGARYVRRKRPWARAAGLACFAAAVLLAIAR